MRSYVLHNQSARHSAFTGDRLLWASLIALWLNLKHVLQEGIYAWCCKPGQNPVTKAIIGPSMEIIAIVLLNRHMPTKLLKHVHARRLVPLSIGRRRLVCSGLWLLQIHDGFKCWACLVISPKSDPWIPLHDSKNAVEDELLRMCEPEVREEACLWNTVWLLNLWLQIDSNHMPRTQIVGVYLEDSFWPDILFHFPAKHPSCLFLCFLWHPGD